MPVDEIVVDFCEDTSCHSLDRVGDKHRKRWVRVIWLLIFLVCISVLIFQLVQLIIRYRRFDVIVDTILEFRALPLPAVTVCNLNLIPRSKVPKDSILESFFQFYNRLFIEQFNAVAQQKICDSVTNDLQWLCNDLINVKNENSLDNPSILWQRTVEMVMPIIINKTTLSDLGNEARKMFFDCSLGNRRCVNFITGFFSSHHGMCVTMKPPNDFRIRASGSAHGLHILLDVNLDEYLSTSDTIGVKVFIHEPNQNFAMESSGILASVGTRTTIALKLFNTTKLGTPYGDCYSFSDTYSLTGCMKSCQQKMIMDRCGCMLFGHGTSGAQSEYCWRDSFKCAMNILHRLTEEHEAISLKNCSCIPTCNSIQHLATVSAGLWPSPYSTYRVVCSNDNENCKKNSINYHRYNSLKLEVFYDTLNYNQYTERPDYTLTDLFTDFGGNLGLFLGASVCTCFEALSLFITLMLYCCGFTKKDFEKKSKISSQSAKPTIPTIVIEKVNGNGSRIKQKNLSTTSV